MSVMRLAKPIKALVGEQRQARERVPTDAQRETALRLVLQAGRSLGAVSTIAPYTTQATALAALDHASSCAAQCETHCADAAAAAVIRAGIDHLSEQLRARFEPT